MSVRTWSADVPVALSASPGFSFGRSGSVTAGTWLQNETVPSNKAGRWVYLNNAKVRRVYVANEDINTFTLEVYYHDGDEINLTLLGSVVITAARGDDFEVEWDVPIDKQLAIKLSSGSAKNAVVGLELSGTR